MDDDVFVNPRLLVNYLENNVNSTMRKSLYAGRVENGPPERNIKSKWYISYKEYKNKTYPPFVSGAFILFSGESLALFCEASKPRKLFKFDDIHLALIAKHLNITPVHMTGVVHDFIPDQNWFNITENICIHSYTLNRFETIWNNSEHEIRVEDSFFLKNL